MHHTEAQQFRLNSAIPVSLFCMDIRKIKISAKGNNLAHCVFLKRGVPFFRRVKIEFCT